jgi:hypothetical protein
MRILKSLGVAVCGLTALALFATASPAGAQPGQPYNSPHYLEGLTDLRTARDYIQSDHRPQFDGQRHQALDEINKAIEEIKHAAWDNGTNTKYAPPAAAVTDPWQPMRMASNWLAEALKQINDIPDQQNQGLQARATRHIRGARNYVDTVIQMAGH